MNSNPHNPMATESVPAAVSGSISSSAEETLRLIASLPAPAGLEDRVHAALRAAPRRGRVLAWPEASTRGATGCATGRMRQPRPSSLWLPAADGAFTPACSTASRQGHRDAARAAAGRLLERRRHAHPGDAARPDRNCPQATARDAKGRKSQLPALRRPSCKRPGRAGRHARGATDASSKAAPVPVLRVLHDRSDQHSQQRQHHRAPEGRAKPVHMEAREPGSRPAES